MTRKNFTKGTLAERFKFCGGRCEWIEPTTDIRCDAILKPGNWHGDHDNPDGLTGEPTFDNCRCLCLPHHAIKTKADVANIAKAKRVEAKHIGVPQPSTPIQSPGFAPIDKKTRRTSEAAVNAAKKMEALGPPAIARRFRTA